MALLQLTAGSPLRTLCLLIAGQPADVFNPESAAPSGMPIAANVAQQPAQVCVYSSITAVIFLACWLYLSASTYFYMIFLSPWNGILVRYIFFSRLGSW